MLALYQDISGVGKFGSIRSARRYSAQLAHSYDALFVSVGGSEPDSYDWIARLGVTHIDEIRGRFPNFFIRDVNRIPGRIVDGYHGMTTTGQRATQSLPAYSTRDGFRLTHNAGFSNGLSFIDGGTPAGGLTANTIHVNFPKTSSFDYNSSINRYQMRQFGGNFVDANDNSRPAFTNVLVLKTDIYTIDEIGRLEIRTTGSGTGYFASGGRYVEINWSRAGFSSPFVYTLKDGTPLRLGRGTTYIGIIGTNRTATFS